jgi:hypothetical protein
MGAPFSDITLYIPTSFPPDSPEYQDEARLENFVSDLYMQKMHGYKPPNTTRVCIQPGFYGTWDHPWKFGSIASIAIEFARDKYVSLDRQGKYRYILDIIQQAMIQCSEAFNWDKSIFEKAHQEVLDCDFVFDISFPSKTSRDKKKVGQLCIEKTEMSTRACVLIRTGDTHCKVQLFEKRNTFWYDCVYQLAKHVKWRDTNSFGVFYPKVELEIYYSLIDDKVYSFCRGTSTPKIDFTKIFWFQEIFPEKINDADHDQG